MSMRDGDASQSRSLRLRRLEAGLYETPDGLYRVQDNTVVGEWDDTEVIWTVEQRRSTDSDVWSEIHEGMTKRKCVEWLRGHMSVARKSETDA